MSEFSATDAAFEGFRVARERPWAIVAWAGVAVAMILADLVLMSTLGDAKSLDEFMQLASAQALTSQKALAVISSQLAYLAASIPISLLYFGIMFAAAFRVVIEPESSKNGLQVGVQELRQTWLIIVSCLILFIAFMGVLFIGSLAVGLAAMISKALGGVVSFLVILGVFAFILFVPIRLSLAGPQTFSEHRLRPFNSWALTRGRFWPMLGTYLLATAFAGIVFLLGVTVLGGLVALTGQKMNPVPIGASLSSYLSLPWIIYITGLAVIRAMVQAILFCPAAVIYQHLAAANLKRGATP